MINYFINQTLILAIMKKTIFFGLLIILGITGLMGQNSGKGFNFQAVARNSDGSVKAEQAVELTITIYPTAEKNAALYMETDSTTTDKFGVFSLIIGKGDYTGGSVASFDAINFGDITAYLNIMLQEGGSDIEIVHAPLLSVPYAESSTQADNGLPIGSIIPYAGEVPDNTDNVTVVGCKGTYKLCNGQAYDEAEFLLLDQVLNGAWGENLLPDLRGVFLRGTNLGATDEDYIDPDTDVRAARYGGNTGNQVGSFQQDTIISHSHPYMDKYKKNNVAIHNGAGSGETVADDPFGDYPRTTSNTGGKETRPVNANVNFIIRVK